ncbi:hypothetical protein CMI37_00390 [Candidatus Pacearchaeota archaeon]|nr:hypothetical protein [Candidatus Pacearchaeota archaeon]
MKLIQRKRTKGWKKPKDSIYVGRGTKWGNPFIVSTTVTAKEAVRRYESYLKRSIQMGGLDLKELQNKSLLCWCGAWKPGEPEIDCHGVILLKMANELK